MAEKIDEVLGLFNSGKLNDAISTCTEAVSKAPMDLRMRLVLAQLTCFTGDWERVEKIVGQVKSLDKSQEHMLLTNVITQLSDAEKTRQQVWEKGLVPDFLAEPDELDKKTMWAANSHRESNSEELKTSMEFIEGHRKKYPVHLDEQNFSDFRDAHDLTATFFEAHSVSGQYYWIPFSIVEKIDVSQPKRPMDFLWNQARISIKDHPELVFYLPGTYAGTFATKNENLLLGRESAFQTDDNNLTIGTGRRVYQLGDDFEADLFEFKSMNLAQEG